MTVCTHVLGNIFVADLGLFVADAELVKRLVEAHVRHDGRDYLLIAQDAAIVHILAADIQNVIACYDVALFVDGKAAVGIAVKGKTNIKSVFEDKLLHLLDMR